MKKCREKTNIICRFGSVKLLYILVAALLLLIPGGVAVSRLFFRNRALEPDVKNLREKYETPEMSHIFAEYDPEGDRSPYMLCGPVREVFPDDSRWDLNGGWGIETYYFPVKNRDGSFSCVLGVLPPQRAVSSFSISTDPAAELNAAKEAGETSVFLFSKKSRYGLEYQRFVSAEGTVVYAPDGSVTGPPEELFDFFKHTGLKPDAPCVFFRLKEE